jgi:hypothetical protein
MPVHTPDFSAAFAGLERALVRRRIAAVEPVLRLEIAALAAFLAAALFWRMRLRLGSIAFAYGPWAATGEAAAALAACALLGGALAGARHVMTLAPGAAGPPWLALPIPAAQVHRHLARASRLLALLAALPALSVLAAALGIVPWLALGALAAGFCVLLDLAARLGCRAAFGIALSRAEPLAGCDAWTRVLAAAARPLSSGRLAAARWRREGALPAFLRKDLLVTRRPGPARGRLAQPLVFGALSVLVWFVPIAPGAVTTVAIGLVLLAAAGIASWIVALAASDPFPVVKALPVGVGVVWGARVAWAALGAVALAAGQAVGAGFAPPPAADAPVAGAALAAFAVAVLGANYAITLFPRADHAERILGIALAIALAASLMFYFVGWAVLLVALLHSARRLPRWPLQEEA